MVWNKYKLLKATGAVILCAGGGCTVYGIYQTRKTLNSILKTDNADLPVKRVEYVYVSDPKINADYEAMSGLDGSNGHSNNEFWVPTPSKFMKLWKHSVAWRLLAVAQKGDRDERLKAVRALARLKHLKDSDYVQLAQVCDARTAVGLARTDGVDLRFFLKPPYSHVKPTKKELMEGLRNMLVSLEKKSEHNCIQYFLSKAFPEVQHRHIFEPELTTIDSTSSHLREDEILPVGIETMLHHATIGDNAKYIVSLGGLKLLMDLRRYFHDNISVLMMLGKLVSNISMHSGVLDDLFMSGWIGVLAEWARHPNIRLSAPAARTLANLDEDDSSDGIYPRRIYLLHPIHRHTELTKMDVVFIHGLLGGVFVTWRQRDSDSQTPGLVESVTTADGQSRFQCERLLSSESMMDYLASMEQYQQQEWESVGSDFELVMADCPIADNRQGQGPYCHKGDTCFKQADQDKSSYTPCWPRDWLPSDCGKLRIIGVNYDTSISMWAPMCPAEDVKRTLDDRSDELLSKLRQAGLGKRPIIWVAHSMGGLLVKKMLVKANQSKDPAVQSVCHNTRAAVFYSVPHQGSPLAALRQATQILLWPSIEVQELREKSPALIALHNHFLELLKQVPIEIVSFAEARSTIISSLRLEFNFVPPCSADPGVGEFYEIPQDHLSICKPASRHSFLYQKLVYLIKKHTVQ